LGPVHVQTCLRGDVPVIVTQLAGQQLLLCMLMFLLFPVRRVFIFCVFSKVEQSYQVNNILYLITIRVSTGIFDVIIC